MKTTLNKIRAHSPCACGCGNPAPIASRTNAKRGEKRGEPLRFISGHNKRKDQTLEHYMGSVKKMESGCWEWQGSKNRKGYGRAQLNRTHHNAHRVIFELSGRLIPDGLHLDHLCRNKSCVNPDHMQPVSAAENNRRKTKPAAWDVQATLLCIVCAEIEQREGV